MGGADFFCSGGGNNIERGAPDKLDGVVVEVESGRGFLSGVDEVTEVLGDGENNRVSVQKKTTRVC